MADTGNTTSPAAHPSLAAPTPVGADTVAAVLCHSETEPHRVGEVAPLKLDRDRILRIGRIGDRFGRQRPGEMIDTGRIRGDRISGEQLEIRAEGEGARVHVVGRAPTIVEGTHVPQDCSVFVRLPAVIEIFGHSVLLLTRRLLAIPAPHRLALPLHPFGGICPMGFGGESPLAYRLREQTAAAADEGRNVLIYGKTGTGKQNVALAIHARSARSARPFVKVNCPVLTPELAAIRLFSGIANWPNPGTPRTVGYFERAEGGTLFLDEIGEISEALQAKLLQALEEGYTFEGETRVRPTGCVVVAATNRGDVGMKEDVRMRFFCFVETPSLDERREDIPPILQQLFRKRAAERKEVAAQHLETDANGRGYARVDGSLIVGLLRSPLRGNVRELDTILGWSIEEARGNKPLRWPSARLPMPAALPLEIRREKKHTNIDALLQGLDLQRHDTAPPPGKVAHPIPGSGEAPAPSKERCLEALHQTHWNFGKAAVVLDISVHALYRLRNKYGLD